MECMQLRSTPGPFHYLMSEQAKSLVALQELQNEVGALLEFRDLVIETFPNLRSKMAPSTPASGARRDWEPGVRVRRKLAAAAGDAARAKPQPSVQDSGFSTETSCGKDAHSSASASASKSRPLEDELWALLDVIQRKGVRLRDEAELLRGELDERPPGSARTAEESFARALAATCGECADVARLREERDELLARAAALQAAAASSPRRAGALGRLDATLDTPARPPRVATPDSKKFAAILLESNPVELQRQLLVSTVQNQVFSEQLRHAAAQRSLLTERLERAKDINEDLKFRLEEKSIELEGARARVRQLEGSKPRSASADSLPRRDAHSSMRDMQPLPLPDDDGTPRRRPSKIPLHKGLAPRPPSRPAAPPAPAASVPPRPPSAHSVRSVRSAASTRSRSSAGGAAPARKERSGVPVRRSPAAYDNKAREDDAGSDDAADADEADAGLAGAATAALAEYVSRAARLAPLLPRLRPLPAELLPRNLALELSRSALYEAAGDALWAGRPQHYFESMHYADAPEEFPDSLAP
ncbi:uncharacterized protein jvl isoform X2 [Epargyreus clarus]